MDYEDTSQVMEDYKKRIRKILKEEHGLSVKDDDSMLWLERLLAQTGAFKRYPTLKVALSYVHNESFDFAKKDEILKELFDEAFGNKVG